MSGIKAARRIKEVVKECDGATIIYTLTEGEGTRVACFGLTLYSIGIEMTDKNGQHTESHLDEIFVDFKRASRFFERLVNNLATPIDLPYILEDEMR